VAEERAKAIALVAQFRSAPPSPSAWWCRRMRSPPVPFDAAHGAQEAVNPYKGKPRDCDLTLVIVWSKLGTPTQVDGIDYPSGMLYEYRDARATQRMVWVYARASPPSVGGPEPA
jgi:hypothetical protein